jgi:acyl-CoA thioesterase YciA
MHSTTSEVRYPSDSQPSIRVVLLPRDTTTHGSIFGGVILSYIDLSASIEAHRHHSGPVVTVAMDKIVFKEPVFVGDVVSFFTETVRIGTTSMTVKVSVWAQRFLTNEYAHVTEATVTMVAADKEHRKTPSYLRRSGKALIISP